MSTKSNTLRGLHRIRTRSSAPVPDWDALQVLLAFAYTVQQEKQRRGQPKGASLSQPEPRQTTSERDSLTAVLSRIAASVQNLTGASGAAIALGKGEEMICIARSGASAPAPGAHLNSREGLSGECIRTGEARLCVNVETDSRVDAASSRALGIGSMIYLPLHWKEKLIGLLGVFSDQPYCFQHRDLRSLRFSESLIVDALRRSEEPSVDLKTLTGTASSTTTDNLLEFPKGPIILEPMPLVESPAQQPIGVFVNRPVYGVETAGETPLEMLARVEIDPQAAAPEVRVAAPEIKSEAQPEFRSDVKEEAESEWKPEPLWSHYRETDDDIRNEVLRWGEDISCVVRHAAPVGEESVPWDFNLAPLPQRNPAIVRVLLAALVVSAVGGALWMERGRTRSDKGEKIQVPAASTSTLPTTVETPGKLRIPKSLGLTKDINYWAATGYTRVTVILRKPVKFDSNRLHDPERIYVDLPGVNLSENQERVFNVDDDVLRSVRIAKYQHDVTRIVFDLKVPGTFTSSMAQSPNRLILEFFSRESKADAGHGAANPKTASVLPASLTVPSPSPSYATSLLRKLKIVIDAGHGGIDTGTSGQQGLQEKQVTLDVAKRLAKLLDRDLGATIVFTRDKDQYVSLASRAEIANRAGADLFISIHANGSRDNGIRGVETFYFNSSNQALEESALKGSKGYRGSPEGKLLAVDLQRSLMSGMEGGTRDRGVKPASFVVLKEVQMPAVLAEISFVTSTKDEQELKSDAYRDKIAKALYTGIASHVERKQVHPRLAAVIAESRGIR